MMKRMLVPVLLATLALLMTGCVISLNGLSFGGISSYDYADAESYTMGGAELDEQIDEIEISWVSGSVKVAYHDEKTVAFSETANEETDEKTTLYYRLRDGRLTIHYAKSGRVNLTKLSKELTVYLPAGSKLEGLSLSLVSSSAKVTALTVDTVDLDTVSGNVDLLDCTLSELKTDTVSGTVYVTTDGEIGSVDVDTVSGQVDLTADAVYDMEVDSVNGDVTLSAQTAPTDLEFNATSGDLTLFLPDEIGMTIMFETVSGKIDIAHETTSSADDRYVIGDGKGMCEFESISGDLHVRKLIADSGGSEAA